MKRQKLTWKEFKKLMVENIGEGIEGAIVFTEDSYERRFNEQDRTYVVNSNAKFWDCTKCGMSLFGNCLDGHDLGVRLDWYMYPEHGKPWSVESCYIIDERYEFFNGKLIKLVPMPGIEKM